MQKAYYVVELLHRDDHDGFNDRQLFDVPPEIEVNYRDLETELPAHLPSFKDVFQCVIDSHESPKIYTFAENAMKSFIEYHDTLNKRKWSTIDNDFRGVLSKAKRQSARLATIRHVADHCIKSTSTRLNDTNGLPVRATVLMNHLINVKYILCPPAVPATFEESTGLNPINGIVGNKKNVENEKIRKIVLHLETSMPPRRSVRRKRPSTQAVEAVANSEGPPVRRRRGQIQPSNETPPPPPLNPALQETVLPVGFLEQVVARVTTEVTKQLQPLLSAHVPPESTQLPGANEAVPTGQPNVPAGQTELPIVGNPVQRIVDTMQTNLSGEQALFPSMRQPKVSFNSINLPVDARVPQKLKTKIWQQEYIDFASLLVNPTLDGKSIKLLFPAAPVADEAVVEDGLLMSTPITLMTLSLMSNVVTKSVKGTRKKNSMRTASSPGHTALCENPNPVALFAQGYRSIFGSDLEAKTIHSAFHIPVNEDVNGDMNFGLNKFDMVVADKASFLRRPSRSTLNRLNVRPVVVMTGDKCQQQPLQTAPNGNDATYTEDDVLKHLHKWNCEWLKRPNIAMLEMAMTIEDNLPLIRQFSRSILSASFVEDLASPFESMEEALQKLDNKDKNNNDPASQQDIINVLRTIDENEALDQAATCFVPTLEVNQRAGSFKGKHPVNGPKNLTQIHKAQELRYLESQLQVKINKLHEFTDGCAAQHNSCHCLVNVISQEKEYIDRFYVLDN
ncbi:hypothetical protein ACROYT_G015408 [Oculina patagonica]